MSRACKVMGYSCDSFYRYKQAVDEGGVEALIERSRRKPNLRNRTAPEIEEAIVARGQRMLGIVAYSIVAVLLGASAGLLGPARLVFLVGLLHLLAVALHNFVVLLITGSQPDSDGA